MNATRSIRTIFGCAVVGCGIIWSIMFPKTGEILRPDFVLSVALGIGLIVTGILCLLMTRSRAALLVLSILFLWSVLTNVVFLSLLRGSFEIVRDIPAMESHNARYWLSILESNREDKITYLSFRLKQMIKEGEEMSGPPKR